MNAITRTVTLDDLTPEELALIFARMDSGRQAEFFDAVGAEAMAWPGLGWCGQCAHIIDSLTDRGAEAVLTLAGHIQDRRGAVHSPHRDRVIMASVKLGGWLSAALDDPAVCEEMKADINEWFSAGEPVANWQCGIRLSYANPDDPPDCNWPVCGCDPYATKVMVALEEGGLLQPERTQPPVAIAP